MLKLGFLTEDGWNATAITVVNNTVDELTAPLVDFSAKSDEVIESKKLSGNRKAVPEIQYQYRY